MKLFHLLLSRALVTIRPQPPYRRQAFEQGLKRLGYTLIDGYGKAKPQGRDDLLVVWNVHAGPDEAYARKWEQLGGTVIVSENGYLQQVDKTYFALSTHGHNGAGWFPVLDDDRFSKLGFALQPPRAAVPGGQIVVRAQRGIGSKAMRSPQRWAENRAQQLRAAGAKNVVVVPHPGDKGKLQADEAALAKASRVEIWSSALGVRALVKGIPVKHHAPHWVCERHGVDGREAALQRMAHGQWHCDEIASGEPFARMQAHGWGPQWR